MQFIKCIMGFFHISLQLAHRSYSKVSQKLAEKASEGESLTMMVPEISGSCFESWVLLVQSFKGEKKPKQQNKMCVFPEMRMQRNTA